MNQADLPVIAVRTLEWPPAEASIKARVFALIKPRENSFVWGHEPAIFLYLDAKSRAQFENTVAHECHHIGLTSFGRRPQSKAVEFLGGFGEGEAMLAAAGSAAVHHSTPM